MRGEPQKTPQISSWLPVQEINSRSVNKLAQKIHIFHCTIDIPLYLYLERPSPISVSPPLSISLPISFSLPTSISLLVSIYISFPISISPAIFTLSSLPLPMCFCVFLCVFGFERKKSSWQVIKLMRISGLQSEWEKFIE